MNKVLSHLAGTIVATSLSAEPDLQLTATVQPTTHLEIGQIVSTTLHVENIGPTVSLDRLNGAVGEAFIAFPLEVVGTSPCSVSSLDIDPPAFHFFWNSDEPLEPGESERCIVTLKVIREPTSGEYRLNLFTDDIEDLNPENDARDFLLKFGPPNPIPVLSSTALLIFASLVIIAAIPGVGRWHVPDR